MLVCIAMNIRDVSTYQSYLLRLWRDNPQAVWRASVQSTVTEEVRHFATIDDLWTFLMAQMAVDDEDRSSPNNSSG